MNLSSYKTLNIGGVELTKLTINGVLAWEIQGRIPSAYQEVEWIKAAKGVSAYFNLGFAFDTSATIYIEQFLDSAPSWVTNEQTYIFGASDSTGTYRCMFTSPENNNGAMAYGSSGSSYVLSNAKYIYGSKNNIKIVIKKGDLHWENLDTNEVSIVKKDNIAFTMKDNLFLLAQNYKGSPRFNGTNGHERCVGRFSYYDKNDSLICDLVPCYRKSDNVAGMYDIVRKIFLTNAGSGSFTVGSNV